MDNLDSNSVAVFAVIAVLVLLAIAAWAMQHRRQSERLQQRFGTEYTHTVDRMGSREKAEAELLARERRVERLHLASRCRRPTPALHAGMEAAAGALRR